MWLRFGKIMDNKTYDEHLNQESTSFAKLGRTRFHSEAVLVTVFYHLNWLYLAQMSPRTWDGPNQFRDRENFVQEMTYCEFAILRVSVQSGKILNSLYKMYIELAYFLTRRKENIFKIGTFYAIARVNIVWYKANSIPNTSHSFS